MSEDYDMSIHQNPSARAWARFFIETRDETNFTINEDLMIGWFSNAMMAMHDHILLRGAPINGDHAAYMLGRDE